jgi:hypothetical protein
MVTKYLRKLTLKMKGLFWFTVSGISVYISVLHSFGACGEAEHHDRVHVKEKICSPHGGQEAKSERLEPQYLLRGHCPRDLISFTSLLSSNCTTDWQPSLAFWGHSRFKLSYILTPLLLSFQITLSGSSSCNWSHPLECIIHGNFQ